mgnify:CR=1 FL=1
MPHQTTTVSTKGQVILPKALRDKRNWAAGTRLIVEETSDGVVLKQAPAFEPSAPDTVFAMLETSAPPLSIEEMDAAVLAEARARDRD